MNSRFVGGAALLMVASTVISAPAASNAQIPTTVQVTDPAGDANFVNDQNTEQDVGDVTTGATGAQDILHAWVTHDAARLAVNIHTAARPVAESGALRYSFATKPAGSSESCVYFDAWINQTEQFAFLYDDCDVTSPRYTSLDLTITDLRDGTSLLALTTLRRASPRLGQGATLSGPTVRSIQYTDDVPYAGLAYYLAYESAGTYPPVSPRRSAIVDDTVPGRDVRLGRGAPASMLYAGKLTRSRPLFWDGGHVAGTNSKVWTYALDVSEPAQHLRIAAEGPVTNNYYAWIEARAYGPKGEYIEIYPGNYGSGTEALIKNPSVGRWLIEVKPWAYPESIFRMRAALENSTALKGKMPLLPNLRSEPPHEFTFQQPTAHWLASGVQPSQNDVCTLDEEAEESAERCLRLWVGAQNVGIGRLELRFSPVVNPNADLSTSPIFQKVTYADGTSIERPAGTFEYHKTHMHYHYTGFATLELYRVTDRRRGTLERAGDGRKSGFCLGDVKVAEWHRPMTEKPDSAQSDCASLSGAGGITGIAAPTGGWMGISSGWTDVYSADAPGNYVEFGSNPDGLYVVRSIVDPGNNVLEVSDADNVGYALIRVTGEDVTLIERGLGSSPWDPRKRVLGDWWPHVRPLRATTRVG